MFIRVVQCNMLMRKEAGQQIIIPRSALMDLVHLVHGRVIIGVRKISDTYMYNYYKCPAQAHGRHQLADILTGWDLVLLSGCIKWLDLNVDPGFEYMAACVSELDQAFWMFWICTALGSSMGHLGSTLGRSEIRSKACYVVDV